MHEFGNASRASVHHSQHRVDRGATLKSWPCAKQDRSVQTINTAVEAWKGQRAPHR